MKSESFLFDILRRRKDETAPAIHFYGSFSRNLSLTCGELLERSQNVAASLASISGSLTGQHVLVALPNEASFLDAFFGIQLAGGIPVPIVVAEYVPPEEYAIHIENVVRITGATLLISRKSSLFGVKLPPSLRVLDPDSFSGNPSGTLADFSSEALVQFSSGSTREPRGVVLSHRNILANLTQIRDGLALVPSDRAISWLPFYHDMGLIGGVLAPLFSGIPIHILSPVDFLASPYRYLKLTSELGITLIMGPDFSYRTCQRRVTPAQIRTLDLSKVRLALSGAEPVSAQTCRAFLDAFAPASFPRTGLFPVYGLAESSLAVSFPPVGRALRTETIDFGMIQEGKVAPPSSASNAVEVVSCGRPLPGTDLRIVDARDQRLEAGRIGRIIIRSQATTSGYLANAEETRALFRDGWLVTGDLGFLDDGELFVVGREKDVIKINGKAIHPPDLERRASEVRGYKMGRCAAISAVNPANGIEEAYLVVESRELFPGRRRALRSAVSMAVSALTPIPPERILVTAPCAIPRTSSGKSRRFELRRRLLAGDLRRNERTFLRAYLGSRIATAHGVLRILRRILRTKFAVKRRERTLTPAAALEARLVEQFAAVIGKNPRRIRLDDDFSKYRIDSAALIRLQSQFQAEIGDVPLRDLVACRNLRQLHGHLMEGYGARTRPSHDVGAQFRL